MVRRVGGAGVGRYEFQSGGLEGGFSSFGRSRSKGKSDRKHGMQLVFLECSQKEGTPHIAGHLRSQAGPDGQGRAGWTGVGLEYSGVVRDLGRAKPS